MDKLLVSAVIAGAFVACGADGTVPADSRVVGDAAGADAVEVPCECAPGDGCGLNACGAECGDCSAGRVCLGGVCEAATACDREGMSAFVQRAALVRTEGEGATLDYRADSRASAPFERLVIRSYERLGGPAAPGTYPITDDGYADCALCVLAYQGCTQAGCARTFLADAGAVAIDTISGGRFEATVRAARFPRRASSAWSASRLPPR
ncbi:MAG: hypothetical protein CSA66_00020 [Proteobacteria bacterium]|nr:MAG: hypothetical protein CSA66_00020 [Pseudomonadota bacterium]